MRPPSQHTPNGVNGINDTHGVNGTNGTIHANGINGTNETSHTNGVNGIIGTSHTNGVNGTNGTSHANDVNGTNGTSYTNGVNGSSHDEPSPLAIIGMACRLPGKVTTLEEFWQLCSRRRNAWSEVPSSRWNAEGFYHPNPDRNGAINARGGHFLDEDVALFDAPFFNITRQEALSMDPQQRLLLECTYEAFENGGITKADLAARQVGVFVGCSPSDYEVHNYRDVESIPIQQVTGNFPAVLSNRISHAFDLNGPSFTVDTACSASLTAMHLACQSLRRGECSIAVVAASHLNLLPEVFASYSKSRLLSDSGRCYPFDHKASGFGRGEGAGCVILKSYQDAVDDDDNIRALTVDSSINQDGRTRGIATPNPVSQAALMRSTYHNAGVDPANVGYVEAHGTGTKVGDPLEAFALQSVFSEGRTPKNPLFIGSVKSNIGHAEGASGVISVIKTALMLQHGFVLPTCGFEKPNEKIPLAEWNLKVPAKQLPWPRGKEYAAVNNFGVGGSNAHVILKKAPLSEKTKQALDMPNGLVGVDKDFQKHVIALSASDKDAAMAQVKNVRIWLEKNPDVYDEYLVSNLAYTLGQRRNHLSWRVAFSGALGKDLIAEMSGNVAPSYCPEAPVLGFAFTGQGAQWHAMGRELMTKYPIYMNTLRSVDSILTSLGAEFSLIDELSKDEADTAVSEAYMSQPACNAVQLALTDLLRSWGAQPSAVVGHSSGEIAAAYAAGILTLDQCVRIAYARGQAAQILGERAAVHKGAMMAVPAGAEQVQELLDTTENQGAVVACINSPSSVTVSGDEGAVDELEQVLKKQDISARKLNVAVAYHSPHVQQVAQKFGDMMGKIEARSSDVSFYSSVTGERIDGSELNQTYWVRNLLSRVSFSPAMSALLAGDESTPAIKTVVEVGPHSVLQGPIREIVRGNFSGEEIKYIPTLKRNHDAIETIQGAAIGLYTAGTTLNFEAVNFPTTRKGRAPELLINLPKYPWNHSKRYWHESRVVQNHLHRKFPRNDILGSLMDTNIDLEPRWRNIIRLDHHPWIRQHKIFGDSVYPTAGFFSMAVEAVMQQASLNNIQYDRAEFRDITMDKQLIIPDGSQVETMLAMKPCTTELYASGNMWFEFHIYSWESSRGWEEHCQGFVSPQGKKQANPVDSQDSSRDSVQEKACPRAVRLTEMYKNLTDSGLNYGPLFQGISALFVGDKSARATFEVPDTRSLMPEEYETSCIVHPVTLETCMQMVWPLCGFDQAGEHQLCFPTTIKHMEISNRALSAGTQVEITSHKLSADGVSQSFTMTNANDPSDVPVKIDGCVLKPMVTTAKAVQKESARSLCFRQDWKTCLDFVHQQNNPMLDQTDEDRDWQGASRMRLLRHVALLYISRALEQFPAPDLNRMRRHRQQLYKWMESVSQHREVISYCQDDKEALIERTRALSLAGELICKVGEHLPAILSGKVRPLSLMSQNDLNKCYEELDCYRQSYSNAVSVIDKLAHKNPNMEILEVGTGTGSATLPILQCLGGHGSNPRRFGHYTCTDMNPSALDEPKSKLQAWGPLVSYKTLDISVSPDGYKAHSYDLIVACNVLHAAPRVAEALKHLKKLLRPGGKLLLIEEATMHPALFPFAALPGFWLNEDMDRASSPLMDKERWESSLFATGFSGVDLALDDYPDTLEKSCLTLLSTAEDEEADAREPINKDVVIVQHESTNLFPLGGLINAVCRITRKAAMITELLHADVDGKLCIFLGDVDRAILSELTPELFHGLQRLLTRAAGVLWVSGRGDTMQRPVDSAMALGLSRTLRRETNTPIATLDLGDLSQLSQTDMVRMTMQVFRSISACQSAPTQGEMEFSVRNGQLCVPRFVEDSELDTTLQQESNQALPQLQKFYQKERSLTLAANESVVPDGLYFTDDNTLTTPLPGDFVEVQISYAGLNFKDVLTSMSDVPGSTLGLEASGVLTAVGDQVKDVKIGDKVCVLAFGSLSNTVRCRAANVCKKPESIPMDLAASVPAVFCTAYYSLVELSRLEAGETVLIHSAAGGLGQASILIAQLIGATVLATVSTPAKKDFLVKMYGLSPSHIFYSRDTSFSERVLEATDGRGADVVVNSLPGDALRASFECVAPFGRFIEVGKRDIQRNARLGMLPFDKNVSFTAVDLALAMTHNPKLVQRLLRSVFELIGMGAISLAKWPVSFYPVSEVDEAFRALRGGKTIGKLVIQMEKHSMVRVHPARRPGQLFHQDAAYVIVGGTRGIGLDVTPWMVEKGARHLILVSRSGPQTPEARDTIASLTAQGVTVEVCQCDIGHEDNVGQHLLPLLSRTSKVGGVIFGPMVLRDVMFEKMAFEDFDMVIRPRVHGLWNVHNTLLALNKKVDFFINLSSVASTIGNLTQSAYAASGSFMAAFEEHRASLGLPCSTIELAPVSGTGSAARDQKLQDHVSSLFGNEWIDINDIQGLFAAAIRGDMKKSSTNTTHCITGLGGAKDQSSASRLPWTQDPRFSHLLGRSTTEQVVNNTETPPPAQASIADTLARTQDPETIINAVASGFVQKLSGILMIPVEEIDPSKPVSAFGLDSLVAIEARYWINSELQANLQLLQILAADSSYALAVDIIRQSGIISDGLKTACHEHFEKGKK